MNRVFRRQREEGQTAIEFALAMPFLLMFILFLIDLALLGFSVVSVTNAVREGARCGVVGGSDAAIIERVESNAGFAGVTASVEPRDGTIGSDITVRAEAEYDFITPVSLVPGISGSISYSRESVMRMETASPYEAECG